MNYMDLFKLEGRTAIVCGGLGLIGKEVSIALAEAGARVIVLDIDKKRFEKCADFHYGLNIHFVDFDIKNQNRYGRLLLSIQKKYGAPNILVNVAYPKTKDWNNKLENVNVKSWKENVEMQMNSSCLLTKEVAQLMLKNRIKGSIINFGSTYGVVGPDFNVYSGTDMTCPAAYSAIKGGIANFTRYAASYYGKYGIRVNCLCPGGVFNKQPPPFLKEYKKRTPLGRMARSDEIAAATLFLASDASSYITGTIMMVDGGWTCI